MWPIESKTHWEPNSRLPQQSFMPYQRKRLAFHFFPTLQYRMKNAPDLARKSRRIWVPPSQIFSFCGCLPHSKLLSPRHDDGTAMFLKGSPPRQNAGGPFELQMFPNSGLHHPLSRHEVEGRGRASCYYYSYSMRKLSHPLHVEAERRTSITIFDRPSVCVHTYERVTVSGGPASHQIIPSAPRGKIEQKSALCHRKSSSHVSLKNNFHN